MSIAVLFLLLLRDAIIAALVHSLLEKSVTWFERTNHRELNVSNLKFVYTTALTGAVYVNLHICTLATNNVF